MEQDMNYRQQQVDGYRRALEPLLRYLPWLEQSAGSNASRNYNGETSGVQSIAFPVYDSTLLHFVRDAEKTEFMDRNYPYIYTRNRIKDHMDERRVIQNAGINEWNILCGILSNYVLGGRTKATLWNEGIREQIFYLVIKQMQEIIDYWDKTSGNMV